MIPYRHGDLQLHPLAEKPEGIKEIEFNGSYVLAYGETTGHKHVLIARENLIKLYKDEKGRLVLHILGENQITHEEHVKFKNGSQKLAPGWYRLGNEQEFNYWENSTRRVQD